MEALTAVIVIVGVLGLIMLYIGVIQPRIEELKLLRKSEEIHNETYLSKSGGTSLYFPPSWNKIRDGKQFNYYLRSFDGGKNWFAIEKEKLFNEVVVLGLVDHVYPGLMDHLEGVNNLSKQVTEKDKSVTDSENVKANHVKSWLSY